MYCSVILRGATKQIDRPFTYRIPEELAASVLPGSLVTVPLGLSNSQRYAVVIELDVGFDGDPDIADAEFEFNSKTKTFKITDIAGNVTEGTYDISEDGVLSFSQLPTFGISTNKNIKFESSTNELQVITYELSDRTGDLTDLWLGSKQYDDQGNAYEYLAYHFKKQTGGAQVESFTGKLSYSDTGWAFLESSEV